ncbi:MAG: EAL domain-containing protein [Xenococcaceae cyanobacterium]
MEQIKILIVEDEPVLALDLASKLRKLDYEIIDIVSTGEVAINLVQQTEPDLIFMDIKLKGAIDGIETATQILQLGDIPIIYLTACADEETVERAEHTGCYGYMIKPCKQIELSANIKIVLKKHQELAQAKISISKSNQSRSVTAQESSYNLITQLPNRLDLQAKFTQISSQYTKLNDFRTAAIIYLNVDRFYRINNNLGHEYGNLLLQQIAQRLQTLLRDDVLIAHLNADEFALVFLAIENRQQILGQISQVIQQFNQPFWLDRREIFVTSSMGIAVYPWDSTEIEQLLQKAYQAMSQAKQQGGNQYNFYQATVEEEESDVLALETDLRYALDRQELQLHYQPQISLETGKIVGVEALLRWYHPHQGIIYPGTFIPLAEQTGLISVIGEWALAQACQQMKIWQLQDLDLDRIAVNLSARQFNQTNLGKTLIKILKQTQLDSHCLELELTESTLVADLDLTIRQLNTLKSLGVKISVDDFGTGYSSFSYLQNFPFDILKIDRSFIKDIGTNPKNAAITKALIEMAHQLSLKVIAEGVETNTELNFLVKNRCDEVQGYFFSPPLSVPEVEQLLQEDNMVKKNPDYQIIFE